MKDRCPSSDGWLWSSLLLHSKASVQFPESAGIALGIATVASCSICGSEDAATATQTAGLALAILPGALWRWTPWETIGPPLVSGGSVVR